MNKHLLVSSIILFAIVSASDLSEYFTKCEKSSPTFGGCLLQNAATAVTKLSKSGIPKLKLNPLSPVEIDRIDLQATPSLKVVLKDAKFYGFETTTFDAIELTDTELNIDLKMEVISLICQYEMAGQILVVPIQGTGAANITLDKLSLKYSAKLDIVDKNGNKYYKVKDDKMAVDAVKVYYFLDNLFNGDKTLGEEMNRFLNEGWKDVFEEVRDAIARVISLLSTNYVAGFLEAVPISDLFG